MENSLRKRQVRRALWTLLFLVIATASMVGPTQAVSGLVAASVSVSETFAELFEEFAGSPAATNGKAKNAKGADHAVTPEIAGADPSIPSATDLDQLLDVMAANSSPSSYVGNGTQGGQTSNGGGGNNAVNGGGSSTPNRGGGTSSAQGTGQVPAPGGGGGGGTPGVQSEASALAGENSVTQPEGDDEPGNAASSSAGGPPPNRGTPNLDDVLDDVAAGLPSVLSSPDFPSLPDDTPKGGAPDNIVAGLPSALSPPGLPSVDDTSNGGAAPITTTTPEGDTPPSDARLFEAVAIPEPTMMLLLGTGAAGYIAARRRRRIQR